MRLKEILEWSLQIVKKGFYVEITVKNTPENLRIIKKFKEAKNNERH